MGGPQGRSGQVRKISPPPGFDPRTVQPIASRNSDWATRPTTICINATKCYVIRTWPVLLLFCESQHHERTEGRCKFPDRVFFFPPRIPSLPWTGFSSTDKFLPHRMHIRSQFPPLIAFFQYRAIPWVFLSSGENPALILEHVASNFRNAKHISEICFLYLPFFCGFPSRRKIVEWVNRRMFG